jgi:hypothetical protein
MKPNWLWAVLLGCAIFTGLTAAPASAQATRTWVSGVGDDANPCSRTAPCKTFAGAISKTAPSGEINCIDPGGFGALTITKSIAIICDNVEAGVLVSGTNGIIVNAGAADTVFLSGLDIEGIGTGLNGVKFLAGAALHVANSVIRGFSTGAPDGNAILFSPSTLAKLYVTNSTVSENGVGIEVKPSGAGGAQVFIDGVHAANNVTGIRGNGTGTTGEINVSVKNSEAAGNTAAGFNATSSGAQVTQLMLNQVVSANNGSFGIRVDGAGATARFGNSAITGNATGTSAVNSGVLASYGNNQINGNTADGPNPPTIPLK